MAYEDFTTYDESDEGSDVTVTSSKISWVTLDNNETAHVSDSKGVAHFNDDFEHKFEIQYSNIVGNAYHSFWVLANFQIDVNSLIANSKDFVNFFILGSSLLGMRVYENGNMASQDFMSPGPSPSTTYYITLSYDRDGGANNTGQYTAEIRTGSHTGTLEDTLTVDCSAGEQNDFEYIFGLSGYDETDATRYADGFTQNLDLQEEVTPYFEVESSDATSTILGSLDSQPELVSSTIGVSGVDGVLNVDTKLAGFAAGIAETGGELVIIWLSILKTIIGLVTGVGDANGSLDVAIQLVSFTVGTSEVSGSLNVDTELVGSTTGISGVDGSISFIEVEIEVVSSAIGISGAFGSLDTQPGLKGSSSSSSSTVGGVTLISMDFVGSSSGTSDVIGTLNVAISLVSEAINAISIVGFVCVIRRVYGVVTGVSSIEGYLGIVPDFNASTLFWRPQNDIIETLEWKTSILKANDGTEQRIKVRQSPRQHFKLEFIFPTNKLNTWYDSIIHTWQKLTWLIPVWPEYVEHFEDINSHDMTVMVDTTNADFRNNSKAIVWKSSTEYEILVVDSKTNSQLNLGYSLLNSFSGIKYIIPVRTAYLISSSKKERYNSEVSVVSLVFAVYDNIDQLEDRTTIHYDGYEILDAPSFMGDTHLESSDGDIFIADFRTGIFKVESDSIYNFLSQNHSFFNDTKEACWNFRKFLYSLDGRQKVILIPTFRSDVVQIDDIAALDTSVKIENIGLVENMGFNSLRTYIGFYFPATGILTIRKITAITELDSLEEQIDFDANLGLLVESGDCKIGFVDKCRLASDKVEIRWPQAHKNECRTNFMRVP